MALPNVDKLTYAELLKLEERVSAAIAAKKAEDAALTKQALRQLAEKRGFNIDELFGKRGRRTAAPKYRNPANPEETWTGRGRKPNWLVAALKKNGGKIDVFAI